MKKFLVSILISLLSLFLLSGCGESSTSTDVTTVQQEETQTEQISNFSPPQVPTLQTN